MAPSRTPCDCRKGEIYRIEREWWMRLLLPSRSRYRCASCGHAFLLTDAELIDTRVARMNLPLHPAPAAAR